jgi:hypothetical protein
MLETLDDELAAAVVLELALLPVSAESRLLVSPLCAL